MKLFKNKIFLTLLFVLSLFILSNSKVHASNDITIDDFTYTMPDWFFEYEYRSVFVSDLSDTVDIHIACSDVPYQLINGVNEYQYSVSGGHTRASGLRILSKSQSYYDDYISNAYLDLSKELMKEGRFEGFSFSRSNTSCYTTHDLYYNDTLVFQRPPQVKGVTLAPIVEEVETQKTLMEVVGILPLTILVVVSLVGLRKALTMLYRLLHQS